MLLQKRVAIISGEITRWGITSRVPSIIFPSFPFTNTNSPENTYDEIDREIWKQEIYVKDKKLL